jgi:hypothetical protein
MSNDNTEDDPIISATAYVPKALVDAVGEAAFVAHVRREMAHGLERFIEAYADELAERFIHGSGGPPATGLVTKRGE